MLDRPGNSGAADRIALMERYLARFGAESIGLLLADREFIGVEWFNWLTKNDIPFAIRMRGVQRATNRPGIDALGLYRRRRDIELVFADAKTRGLNLEDTRLTCPRKLDLLMALVAIALAWASATAAALLGHRRLPRKSHGYPAKSVFRIGFEYLRHLLRTDPFETLTPWKDLNNHPPEGRAV